MTELYQNNIKSLTASGIIYHPIDVKDSDRYKVERCKNGCMTLQVKIDERWKYAHSKYDPIKEAKKFVQDVEFTEAGILVCFGIWFGYYTKELLAKMSDMNQLIIYEPDLELVDLLLNNVDCRPIFEDKRVKIYSGEKVADFYNYLYETVPWYDYERMQGLILPLYRDLYKESCIEFLKAITSTMRARMIDKNTSQYFNIRWTNNFIRNIPFMLNGYSVYNFAGECNGKPVVIVASGPSLDKNIELLKTIKGKVMIIALLTSVKVLLKHDIIPDLMISVDGQQGYWLNNESDAKGMQIPLLYISVSNHDLTVIHKGKKIHILSPIDKLMPMLVEKYEKERLFFALGGSVACVATEVVRVLGFSNIIFIGLDLSNPDDKLHATGTEHIEKTVQDQKERIEKIYIEDIYGGKVGSTDVLYSYVVWFEQHIRKHQDNTTYIDATEGGALIKGTKIMTFQEAIDAYCQTGDNVDEMLNTIFAKGTMFTDSERLEISKDLLQTIHMIPAMLERIEHAVELSKKLVSKYKYNAAVKQTEVDRILTELDQVDYEIEHTGYLKMLISLEWEQIVYLSRQERKPDEEEKLFIAQKNVTIYEACRDVFIRVKQECAGICPQLEQIIQELEERGVTVG